jgi:hypothetical protein
MSPKKMSECVHMFREHKKLLISEGKLNIDGDDMPVVLYNCNVAGCTKQNLGQSTSYPPTNQNHEIVLNAGIIDHFNRFHPKEPCLATCLTIPNKGGRRKTRRRKTRRSKTRRSKTRRSKTRRSKTRRSKTRRRNTRRSKTRRSKSRLRRRK